MPNAQRLRYGRVSELYRIYLCTAVVRDRRPIFTDWQAGRLLIHTIRWQDTQGFTRTIAFVVMPDHIHWLFELRGSASLSRVMQSTKKHSARSVNRLVGRRGSLWQPGFHDHALRREEDLREMARYVVLNPIRAGLVRSLREYPLWDAMWI